MSELNLDIHYRPMREYPWPKTRSIREAGIDYDGPEAFFVFRQKGFVRAMLGIGSAYRYCDGGIRKRILTTSPRNEVVELKDVIGFQLVGTISISRDQDGKNA